MKLRAIHFDRDKRTIDGNPVPARIEVEMTLDEAWVIARMCGRLTGANPATSEIYDELVGSVFNRFWDDGVDGAARHVESTVVEQPSKPS